jgi:hypothetical protein
MTDKKIVIEYELPIYPIPPAWDKPKDFQSVGKLRLLTDMDHDPNFCTADKLEDIGRELQSRANHIVKGAMDVMRSDEDTMKFYLVGDKEPYHKSTELNSKPFPPSKTNTYYPEKAKEGERTELPRYPASDKQKGYIRQLITQNSACMEWMDDWQEKHRVPIDFLEKREASDIISALKALPK